MKTLILQNAYFYKNDQKKEKKMSYLLFKLNFTRCIILQILNIFFSYQNI